MPLQSTSKKQARLLILGFVFFAFLALSLSSLVLAQPAYAQKGDEFGGDEATPTTVVIPPEIAEPPLPENPTRADMGAVKYWGVCMACHGNAGQGLTDEFRELAFGEDMNCWASRCHASNHPPQGFEFPRQVPAIVGAGTLKRFVTAQELKDYILDYMPWWSPASMTDEEAWNVTAYLLRENGVIDRDVNFNPKNAVFTPVHLTAPPVNNDRTAIFIFASILGLAAMAYATRRALEKDSVATPKRPNFIHHLHPPTIPALQARWRYTLGAGGLGVFLALVLGVTGTLEMFFYVPTTAQAGLSIQEITFLVPYGALIRGLHFWAAQALVVVAVVHLIRVVFTGSFVPPRRFNFILGVVLLVITLFMNFTGYVLRWDEGIRWALVVGTNLLKTIPGIGESVYGFVIGGPKPGDATLTRFYAWHIFGLTLVMVFFLAWHLFRVRRDGGIAAPTPAVRENQERITRFELVRREVLAMIIAGVVLIIIALFIPAPLSAPIKEIGFKTLSAEVRAPWFFLWIQQLLRFGDAFWFGIGAPLILLGALIALPYIVTKIPEEQKGKWFPRAGRIAQVIVGILAIGWLVLTILEILQ